MGYGCLRSHNGGSYLVNGRLPYILKVRGPKKLYLPYFRQSRFPFTPAENRAGRRAQNNSKAIAISKKIRARGVGASCILPSQIAARH